MFYTSYHYFILFEKYYFKKKIIIHSFFVRRDFPKMVRRASLFKWDVKEYKSNPRKDGNGKQKV